MRAGLRVALEAATAVNVYLNATEPWKLVKNDPERAAAVLWTALQAIAGLRVGFAPYLPFTTARLGSMIGGTRDVSAWARPEVEAGTKLGAVSPLFIKVADDIIDEAT